MCVYVYVYIYIYIYIYIYDTHIHTIYSDAHTYYILYNIYIVNIL